jgi:acetyl-CoA C-acetyltransferase
MAYELYLQMQGRAGERQRKDNPHTGVVHNLGGFPWQNVCSVSVLGAYGT